MPTGMHTMLPGILSINPQLLIQQSYVNVKITQDQSFQIKAQHVK